MLPCPPSHVPQCQSWPSTSTCDRVGHPSAQYMPEETQHDNAHYSSPSSRAQIARYLMQPLLTLMDLNSAHHQSGSWFRPLKNQNRTILNRTNGPVQGSPNFENRTIGPVLGSQKYLKEPDRTEPYHPYTSRHMVTCPKNASTCYWTPSLIIGVPIAPRAYSLFSQCTPCQ
jgi:hypothetical protein